MFNAKASNVSVTNPLDIQKINPPFPLLPSFPVCAIILSYAGFQVDVKYLLKLLSRNTLVYFSSHKMILQGFITLWRP